MERGRAAMIYWGSRDPSDYLGEPGCSSPHRIVAIAGGAGFLHFVEDSTQELLLLDRNPEALQFCLLIWAVIPRCADVFEFLSVLSGRQTDRDRVLGPDCLRDEPYDYGPLMASLDLESGKMLARLADQVSTYPEEMLLFEAPTLQNLKTRRYFWLFGSTHQRSPFRDNHAFLRLKKRCERVQPVGHQTWLEEFDFSRLDPVLPTLVLASNADNSHYSSYRAIASNIVLNMAPGSIIYYRSWRTFVTFRGGLHHEDALKKIQPLTRGKDVCELKTFAGHSFSTVELEASAHQVYSLETLPSDWPHDDYDKERVFLYHISLRADGSSEQRVSELLEKVAGHFSQIVILDHRFFCDEKGWLARFEQNRLHHIYYVDHLEWSGGATGFDRNVVISLRLRGFSNLTRAATDWQAVGPSPAGRLLARVRRLVRRVLLKLADLAR